jgi:myosin-3
MTVGPFFGIVHYAGQVIYDSNNFLEKNRDVLSLNVVTTLQKSHNSVIRELFATSAGPSSLSSSSSATAAAAAVASDDDPKQKGARAATNQLKLSVSATFKNSLMDLIEKMARARPYFVRCIKPNNLKRGNSFNDAYVLQQLRYTGVVETTRIRRDGYALRFTFADFIAKCGCCHPC